MPKWFYMRCGGSSVYRSSTEWEIKQDRFEYLINYKSLSKLKVQLGI